MSARIVATVALVASKVVLAGVIVSAIGTGLSGHAQAFSSYPPCLHDGNGIDVACAYNGSVFVPSALERCAAEDGNPNGIPCLWIDPDTGSGYFVTSANYR